MPVSRNATRGRNAARLVTLEEELHTQIEGILQQREQDTPWNEIEGLSDYETPAEARTAFSELTARHTEVREDLEAIANTRADLREGRSYGAEVGRGREYAETDVPYRAAPSREMQADRPTLDEAFARMMSREGAIQALHSGGEGGLRVNAEDVNLTEFLTRREGRQNFLDARGQQFAAIDIGTGNQGLGLPQAMIPGTPIAFGSGMFFSDLFESRAWTMMEAAGPSWRAGTATANTRASAKIGASGRTGNVEAVGTIARYDDALTQTMVYVDDEWQAESLSADAIQFAVDSLSYEYQDATSYQCAQGNGTSPNNHGFRSYSGGTANTNAARAAREQTSEFHNELAASALITKIMSLRSTLASRGWPPTTIALSPEAFEPLTSTQVSDGTPFDSAFGALFASMSQTLRGMRMYEIVRGFPAAAANSSLAWLYPFMGRARAVHFARGFRLQRDEYTQADDAETRYRLYCLDALQVTQPIALGELYGAAS